MTLTALSLLTTNANFAVLSRAGSAGAQPISASHVTIKLAEMWSSRARESDSASLARRCRIIQQMERLNMRLDVVFVEQTLLKCFEIINLN